MTLRERSWPKATRMPRALLSAVVVTVTLAWIAGCAPAVAQDSIPDRDLAPALTLATSEGAFELAAQRGDPLVFFFSFVG